MAGLPSTTKLISETRLETLALIIDDRTYSIPVTKLKTGVGVMTRWYGLDIPKNKGLDTLGP
jgi:hypothetical protein